MQWVDGFRLRRGPERLSPRDDRCRMRWAWFAVQHHAASVDIGHPNG